MASPPPASAAAAGARRAATSPATACAPAQLRWFPRASAGRLPQCCLQQPRRKRVRFTHKALTRGVSVAHAPATGMPRPRPRRRESHGSSVASTPPPSSASPSGAPGLSAPPRRVGDVAPEVASMCPALRARLGPKLALARAYDGGCAWGWCGARKGLKGGGRGAVAGGWLAHLGDVVVERHGRDRRRDHRILVEEECVWGGAGHAVVGLPLLGTRGSPHRGSEAVLHDALQLRIGLARER